MADNYGYQFPTTLYPLEQFLDGYIQCSTSGTIVTSPLPRGFLTLTRTGTGAYTLVLNQIYFGVLSVRITPVCPTLTEITPMVIQTSSSQSGSGADTIKFAFQTSGAAADIPTGGGFYISLTLARSSVV